MFVMAVVVLSADASLSGALGETISVSEDHFGEHVVVELKPGGAAQDGDGQEE